MSGAAKPPNEGSVVGRMSAKRWQTAGRLATVAVVAIFGRWLTGPTFGYTLFALIWAPIAAVRCSRRSHNPCHPDNTVSQPAATHKSLIDSGMRWPTVVSVAVLTALPWLTIGPLMVAGRLSLILLAVVAVVVAIRDLLTATGLGEAAAGAVASLAWLAWLISPVTMTAQWLDVIGDSGIARLLSIHPLLTANMTSVTAGDWTHQALAYKYLTRLGQDTAFEWPTSICPCVASHAVIAIGAFAMSHLWRRCSTWNIQRITRPTS